MVVMELTDKVGVLPFEARRLVIFKVFVNVPLLNRLIRGKRFADKLKYFDKECPKT